MRKTEQIKMLKLADEYASKQGTMEYESSYEDFIEGYKTALTIPVINQQRELLINFMQWHFDNDEFKNEPLADNIVDSYLKLINCG